MVILWTDSNLNIRLMDCWYIVDIIMIENKSKEVEAVGEKDGKDGMFFGE